MLAKAPERRMKVGRYVKSPVASLCLACSSVRKRVRVTISVLTFSSWRGAPLPLVVMLIEML